MSQYITDVIMKCSICYAPGGWYIYDQFGVLEGPYSHRDAIATLSNWKRKDCEEKQQESRRTPVASISNEDVHAVVQAAVLGERERCANVWGTIYQLERDKAVGRDPDSLMREIARLRAVLHAPLSEVELKLVDKNCDWTAFKHAWNAVMKSRLANLEK